jgi:hypothetical protein
LLRPLNKGWMMLGLILGMIVSPIVLGVLFFLLLTPVSFVIRLWGRDELKLKRQRSESFWRTREQDLSTDAFKRQF